MYRLAVLEGKALEAVQELASVLADACKGDWRIHSVYKVTGGYEVTLHFDVSEGGDVQKALSLFQHNCSYKDEAKKILIIPRHLFVYTSEGRPTKLEAILNVYKVDM